tara:strand:- start:1235 stop:1747 length:513 start_codon:yes stop_codon:yes gene_type:complete
LNQELVTYIILGSAERLNKVKIPQSNKAEEFIPANFVNKKDIQKDLDRLVSSSKGNIIVLIPPSSIPNSKSKELLKKISMIDVSSWGWFKFNDKKNDFINNLKKISSSISSTPDLEQGIFFNKRLYFSVGGIGKFGTSPFKEISKRFYSRIDPQKTLPALIIRTKNIAIN